MIDYSSIDPAGVTLATTNYWISLVNVVGSLTIQEGPLTIYCLGTIDGTQDLRRLIVDDGRSNRT